MRKLTRDQKETMTLEAISAICVCATYCGGYYAEEDYKGIQIRTERVGDPSPFKIETDI